VREEEKAGRPFQALIVMSSFYSCPFPDLHNVWVISVVCWVILVVLHCVVTLVVVLFWRGVILAWRLRRRKKTGRLQGIRFLRCTQRGCVLNYVCCVCPVRFVRGVSCAVQPLSFLLGGCLYAACCMLYACWSLGPIAWTWKRWDCTDFTRLPCPDPVASRERKNLPGRQQHVSVVLDVKLASRWRLKYGKTGSVFPGWLSFRCLWDGGSGSVARVFGSVATTLAW